MNTRFARFEVGVAGVAVLLSCSLAAACGSDPTPRPTCTPGAFVSCACPGGTSATKTCDPYGTYGACQCEYRLDAGPLDAGGGEMDLGTAPDLGAALDLGVALDLGGAPDLGPLMCDEAGLATGTSYLYVINLLSIAAPEGTADPLTSIGYDLDGDSVVACNSHFAGDTAEFDGQAPDFGSGIDNAFGGDLGGLSNAAIQASLDEGSNLLFVEVRGVDSLTDDPCVGVTLYPGALPAGMTAPAVDGAGHLAAGQSFNLLPATFSGLGRIVGGRARAAGGALPLPLPFLGAALALPLRRTQVGFDLSASAVSRGVIGGSITTAEFIASVRALPSLAMYVDVVDSTFSSLADLDEDGTPISCEAGSIALRFDGVTSLRAP